MEPAVERSYAQNLRRVAIFQCTASLCASKGRSQFLRAKLCRKREAPRSKYRGASTDGFGQQSSENNLRHQLDVAGFTRADRRSTVEVTDGVRYLAKTAVS